MGFERNYRVKILPNQCLSRYYYTSTSAIFSSSITNKSILNPLFVTGFIDALRDAGQSISEKRKLKTVLNIIVKLD